MRILLATSELHPYSKTGGLADMVGALAKYLARAGHQVSVVTPLYRGIVERFPQIQFFDWKLPIPLGNRLFHGGVRVDYPESNLDIYFIEQPEFFDRDGIYQPALGDYVDNAERYLFFSKSVVNLARYLPNPPEVVQLNDWQVGMVPALIRHMERREGWGNAPHTCLTIHNLAHQGVFSEATFPLTNLPWEDFTPALTEFYGNLNFLKAGIVCADRVTTVSPTYAREITSPEFGCGLDRVLGELTKPVVGILNGVDYEEWNPEINPQLASQYKADTLTVGKAINKMAVQETLGLEPNPRVPLFVNVSRLAEQKGADLLLRCAEWYMINGIQCQFAFLGKGDTSLESALVQLVSKFPHKVAARIGYDHKLAHRLEAAGDFFVMPSRFEPCGLNQMYSLRYGTVPIVRSTGGLEDSVIDVRDDMSRANGIKFKESNAKSLSRALLKALKLYEDSAAMRFFQLNGMGQEFSWNKAALRYMDLFREMQTGD